MATTEQSHLALRFTRDLLTERALTLEQFRIDTLADLGSGLCEQLEERAGPALFARLQRRGVKTLTGMRRIESHQQIDVEFVIRTNRREEGSAQLLALHIQSG